MLVRKDPMTPAATYMVEYAKPISLTRFRYQSFLCKTLGANSLSLDEYGVTFSLGITFKPSTFKLGEIIVASEDVELGVSLVGVAICGCKLDELDL
jgi:hypothetical protein